MVCAFSIGVAFWGGGPLLAQDDDEAEAARRAAEAARQAAEAQRQAEENRLERERGQQALREFLNDVPGRPPEDRGQERRRRFQAFRTSMREFEAATREFRGSHAAAALRTSAKRMEDSTKGLLDFVKLINKKRPSLDAAEFKNLTGEDLAREIVSTAERVQPGLTAVVRNEGEPAVDVKFLTGLQQLELDLLRLQRMARRLR
jgi:hypothetical protein